MHCWLLFHQELRRDVPEAAEVFRFQQSAAQAGVASMCSILAISSSSSTPPKAGPQSIKAAKLPKPDLIIPRTGSETSYFTLAVLRHFERQGIAMVDSPASVEAVADKLQALQILSGAGIPIPKTILGKFPVDVNVIERELGFSGGRERLCAVLAATASCFVPIASSSTTSPICFDGAPSPRSEFHLPAVCEGEPWSRWCACS